jgi:hypothetical protein
MNISPTLAEFFNLPYNTKMTEESIIISLWHYITQNNLLIDNRLIILDAMLKPVIHPFFLWKGNTDSDLEQSIVMMFIAKMHTDPEFVQQDVDFRLDRIKRNIASRKITRFFRRYCGNLHEKLWEPPTGHMVTKSWLHYLAVHYNGGTSTGG